MNKQIGEEKSQTAINLARSVKLLMRLLFEESDPRPEKDKNRKFAKRVGVSDKTIGNILKANHSQTTTTIEKIASNTGFDVWMLLHPEFDPIAMKDGRFDRFFRAWMTAEGRGEYSASQPANDKKNPSRQQATG